MPQIGSASLKHRRRRGVGRPAHCVILSGILLHGPGLKVKWEYEDQDEYICSMFAAAVEGAFVLLLAKMMYDYTRKFHGSGLLQSWFNKIRAVRREETVQGEQDSGEESGSSRSDTEDIGVRSRGGGAASNSSRNDFLFGRRRPSRFQEATLCFQDDKSNTSSSRSSKLGTAVSGMGSVMARSSLHWSSGLSNRTTRGSSATTGSGVPSFVVYGMGIVLYGIGVVLLPIPALLKIMLFAAVAPAILPAFYLSFVMFGILGDASYRTMTGNMTPTSTVLQTGFADVEANASAQFTHDLSGSLAILLSGLMCLAVSIWIYSMSFKYQESQLPTHQPSLAECSPNRRSVPTKEQHSDVARLLCLGLLAYWLHCLGWYMPVVNVSFAYLGTLTAQKKVVNIRQEKAVNIEQKSVVHHSIATKADRSGSGGDATRPNIIFIQHESLSGAIMLNTDDGVKATPFFQSKMHNDTDFYVFEHTRTVSGNTIDAMPALMTGCLPYTDDGVNFAHSPGRSIGYEFSRFSNRGYTTASFSSLALGSAVENENGQFSMLYDVLVGGMDVVKEPLALRYPMMNADGADDRMMFRLFEQWLVDLGNPMNASSSGEGKPNQQPFYAQMYLFNNHYPFLKDGSLPSLSHRYIDSMQTTDQIFQRLFDMLEKTGHLEDTIIIGSSDHGEEPFKGNYARVGALDSNILHTLSYIYYPKQLMQDSSVADRLRRNTQKLTSTLDMYPTIQGIINGGKYDVLQHTHEGCITGVDLTSVDVPDERVTVSINLGSSLSGKAFGNGDWQARLWSLNTKDLSLFHRKNKYKFPPLKQGPDNFYIFEYGDCTRNISASNMCMQEVNDGNATAFSEAIQWLHHDASFHPQVQESELVKFFSSFVVQGPGNKGLEGAIETPNSTRQNSRENMQLVRNTLIGWSVFGCIVCKMIARWHHAGLSV